MYNKTMSKKRILWIDLEMTGLDPAKDRILEVAAIVTDWDFTEVATYEAVKKVPTLTMKNRMVGDFWKKHSAVRSALMKQNEKGKTSRIVEQELVDFITTYCGTDTGVLLCGNSIHQDRRFIRKEWPKVEDMLHYRMLDVSAWKVVFEGKYRKKFAKPEAHRALLDIRGSIEELKYYIKKMEK